MEVGREADHVVFPVRLVPSGVLESTWTLFHCFADVRGRWGVEMLGR